jgi:DNA-binding transcriptional regulator GbsR (MarR family)
MEDEKVVWKQVQEEFIHKWRDLGRAWGIPPAAAAVHGLLLSERAPMITDDVMSVLSLSRGTAHTQLQFLVEWGLVYPVKSLGSRQIRYVAEKDTWQMMSCIARQRKKRELDPLLALSSWKESIALESIDSELGDVLGKTLDGILTQANAVNDVFNRLLSEDERWWEQWLTRGLRRN